jgi:GxxExxY protein
VGTHRLDLLVEDRIVIELKAVKSIERVHYAVVRSYLRALGLNHGLILNFSEAPLSVRRVSGLAVSTPSSASPSSFPLS